MLASDCTKWTRTTCPDRTRVTRKVSSKSRSLVGQGHRLWCVLHLWCIVDIKTITRNKVRQLLPVEMFRFRIVQMWGYRAELVLFIVCLFSFCFTLFIPPFGITVIL